MKLFKIYQKKQNFQSTFSKNDEILKKKKFFKKWSDELVIKSTIHKFHIKHYVYNKFLLWYKQYQLSIKLKQYIYSSKCYDI